MHEGVPYKNSPRRRATSKSRVGEALDAERCAPGGLRGRRLGDCQRARQVLEAGIMIEHSPLGKTADYAQPYSPDILFSIPRERGRASLPLANPLPFSGVDLWTGYEISWLNRKNKPMVAVGEFRIPAITTNIIESKSFKLYLNSFNATQFDDVEAVQAALTRDLSHAAAGSVRVRLILPGQFGTRTEEDGRRLHR